MKNSEFKFIRNDGAPAGSYISCMEMAYQLKRIADSLEKLNMQYQRIQNESKNLI